MSKRLATLGIVLATTLSALPVAAVTLADVDVDRANALASGPGVLSGRAGMVSLSEAGDLTGPGGVILLPQLTASVGSTGNVSLTSVGAGPSYGGVIEDILSAPGLFSFLFTDTTSTGLFVVDIGSAIIIGTSLGLEAPDGATQPEDQQAEVALYAAAPVSGAATPDAQSSVALVPLPASSLLMLAGLGGLILPRLTRRR